MTFANCETSKFRERCDLLVWLLLALVSRCFGACEVLWNLLTPIWKLCALFRPNFFSFCRPKRECPVFQVDLRMRFRVTFQNLLRTCVPFLRHRLFLLQRYNATRTANLSVSSFQTDEVGRRSFFLHNKNFWQQLLETKKTLTMIDSLWCETVWSKPEKLLL